jgi:hypothetical protein
MKDNLKLITVILATLLLMFATSLLLEIELIQKEWIRLMIVYLAIIIEMTIGFLILKLFLKN